MSDDYQFGVTQPFACNYLPEQEERLLVAVDERLHNPEQYSWLMANGFRRSSDQIYRPHCINCNACKSIRVINQEFTLSKSQKRLLNKNKDYVLKVSSTPKDIYYALYELYINTIHHDGARSRIYTDHWDLDLGGCAAYNAVVKPTTTCRGVSTHDTHKRGICLRHLHLLHVGQAVGKLDSHCRTAGTHVRCHLLESFSCWKRND